MRIQCVTGTDPQYRAGITQLVQVSCDQESLSHPNKLRMYGAL